MFTKEDIEKEFIEVSNEFFDVYINALDVIMDEILTLKPSRYDANSYVILSLRNIEVLIDGMKCLFNKKSTEASQILLRSLLEVSIELIYFIYEPSLVDENNAIYNLCYARDLDKQLDNTYKNYDNQYIKEEILLVRKKYQDTYKKIQELKHNKFGSWYKVAGCIRGQRLNTFKDLCGFIKLGNKQVGSILYDVVYKRTSSYIHGQTMADMVYKVNRKLKFLPIHYLESASFYLIALHYIMELLLQKLIEYLKLQNISLIDLCGSDLNMQRERIKAIIELDEKIK